MQEMWVRSLGQEDHLEKEMATYSNILAWEIPTTVETGDHRFTRVRRNLETKQQQNLLIMNDTYYIFKTFSSVQSLSRVQIFATPWITALQASLSITISQSSLKHTSIKSVMSSSHLTLCYPLLLLPPIPPSIRVFSNESTLHMRWPKYWSFSFSIILSKNTQDRSPLEWTGWISLQCKRFSRVFSNTTVQKHQFFGAQLSSQSSSHIHTWLLEKP